MGMAGMGGDMPPGDIEDPDLAEAIRLSMLEAGGAAPEAPKKAEEPSEEELERMAIEMSLAE